jgi:hypothetical protein
MPEELHSQQLANDPNRKTHHKVRIWINGKDYALKHVVYALTSFELVAGAQPGTGQITLKDPKREHDFQGGEVVKVEIDDELVWTGYVMTVGRGYWFADYIGTEKVSGRRWDLGLVDLNILFDKLFSYNHTNPATFPDGGGTFPKGVVPVGTTDRQYLIAALKDLDLPLVKPTINTTARVKEHAVIVEGPAKGSLMGAGASFRALLADVAGNVNKAAPGSMVFYIDPRGNLVYTALDTNTAPFSVTDDPVAKPGVAVRALQLQKAIGAIKDDVLVFATDLNPDPASKQSTFKYRHQQNATSIGKYGRFQWAENVPGFLQDTVDARALKILTQEGTPGESATFTCFRPGLLPGQIVTVASHAWGYEKNLPVRSISLHFPIPTLAQWDVQTGFDTNDAWGVIMALRRPPTRGFVPPRFASIHVSPGDPLPSRPPYTMVSEVPRALGGGLYQTSYGYIRYSIAVHAGGLRAATKDGTDQDPPTSNPDELIFWENAPQKGQFKILGETTGKIYVQYHVANNL